MYIHINFSPVNSTWAINFLFLTELSRHVSDLTAHNCEYVIAIITMSGVIIIITRCLVRISVARVTIIYI